MFETTVDEIMGKFNKTIFKLKARAEEMKGNIQKTHEEIVALEQKKQEFINEGLAAEKYAKKLEEFISV